MPGTNTQTQGIQQLLAAEKRAAEKVAEARKRKTKRIKQARDEAQAEIEAFRQAREKAYLEYEERYLGTKEDVAARIQIDTDAYLAGLTKMIQKNKDKVMDDLVELAVDIVPQAHPNFFILKTFNKM